MDYSYQDPLIDQAYERFLNSGKVVILAACPGAGKTEMCLQIARRFLQDHPKEKLLIYTHGQTLLRQQWHETVEARFGKIKCGVITKGKQAGQIVKANRLILALPQTLQHADLDELRELGITAVMSDESHQRFLADQVQEQLAILSPRCILGATGTPSYFLSNPDYEVIGITIEELLDYGVITDPLVEIVQSDYGYTIDDFDRSTMRLRDEFLSLNETTETLDHLLPQIVKRLVAHKRAQPEVFDWAKRTTSWKELAEQLLKTMIIANNQRQAKDIHAYFEKVGVKSVLSISDLNEGSEELEKFKSDDDVRVFIVVSRGALGFNYTELFNVIDMSGSLNVNRIFQALCRVVRPSQKNPRQKKLFIKTTNADLAPLTYFVMSFTVALSTKEYYYSYTTERDSDKVRDIPVDPAFMELLGGYDNSTSSRFVDDRDFPDLPTVQTFSTLKERRGGVGTLAFTSFKQVIERVYSKKRQLVYTEDHLRMLLVKYKSRKQFECNEPSAYGFILRSKLFKLLQDAYGARFEWDEGKVMDVVHQSESLTDLRKRFPGAFNWAKRNELLGKIRESFGSVERPPSPMSTDYLQKIINDPTFTITEAGLVYKDGQSLPYYYKRGNGVIPYLRFGTSWVSVPRLVWQKFNGPIPGNKTLSFKVIIPKNRYHARLSNMFLVSKIEASRNSQNKKPATEAFRGNSKIDMETARAIRKERSAGATYPQLSKKYNVSKSSLSYLLNGQTWKEAAKA